MTAVDVVDVAPGDLDHFVNVSLAWWAEPRAADEDPAAIGSVLDRAIMGRTDGEDAGTAAVIDFELSLPGGALVPMDGVTWVVVSSVARRRGVLRAMMEHLLQSARHRGVPLLGLGASESSIYRRFGYGVASHIAITEIDTAHASLRVPFIDPGRLRPVAATDAIIPQLLAVDSRQPGRVGAINRSEASWRRALRRASDSQGDTGPMQVTLHHDAAGVVDGFVMYRIEWQWPNELADSVVHVKELSAANEGAHLALWQHLLNLDLVEHLRMDRGWVDDPIRHLLADGRRLRQLPRDDLHLRIVDVAALLGARRYSREDSLVLELRDPACPDIAGRYRIEGGLDGAAATATDAAADMVLDGPSLAALVLGDVSAASLHAAALIEEIRPGAVRRASAMFSWAPRPWLNYMF